MPACVATAGGAEQITACAVRMALASNAEIFAGKKSRSMSAADTAREGHVYDRHGFTITREEAEKALEAKRDD